MPTEESSEVVCSGTTLALFIYLLVIVFDALHRIFFEDRSMMYEVGVPSYYDHIRFVRSNDYRQPSRHEETDVRRDPLSIYGIDKGRI